jgi:NTP pyrophosphatase (non-canonical NTP hydrolase)
MVFDLLTSLGSLSACFRGETFPLADPIKQRTLAESLCDFFLALHKCSVQTRHDLGAQVNAKFRLNAKKYPQDLCRGKAGKYTNYTSQTGINKDMSTQETELADPGGLPGGLPGSRPITIQSITETVREFVDARQWHQFHTPRNVLLALSGEVGELSEIFQWKGEAEYEVKAGADAKEGKFGQGYDEKDDMHIGQELADVAIYTVRLADLCGVDLDKEIRQRAVTYGV